MTALHEAAPSSREGIHVSGACSQLAARQLFLSREFSMTMLYP